MPDPLVTLGGEKIVTSAQWEKKRRPELIELFRENVYGRSPEISRDKIKFQLKIYYPKALNGAATSQVIEIELQGSAAKVVIHLVLFTPNAIKTPAPLFLLICNRDRSLIDPEQKNKSEYWPVERILSRGYATAAFYYGDVAPDRQMSYEDGVIGAFKVSQEKAYTWKAISAWHGVRVG